MRIEEEPKEVEKLDFLICRALKHLEEGEYHLVDGALEDAKYRIERLEEKAKEEPEEEPKEVEELNFMIRHASKHLVEGQYNSAIAAFEVAKDCINRLEERAKEEIRWESREEEKKEKIYPLKKKEVR